LLSWRAQLCYDAWAAAAVGIGASRHVVDLRAGGDLAQREWDRIGPTASIRRWYGWRKLRTGDWVTSRGVVIGFTRKGELVRVPVAGWRVVMTLVLGATGSGKTIVQVSFALAAIKRGFASSTSIPRGTTSRSISSVLPLLAKASGFCSGARRARRSTTRTTADRLVSLTRKMSPTNARPLLAYLETMTSQQERDLAGARDRLAILAESDVGHLLDPATAGERIDLSESLERGDRRLPT
jgi:hypothetical protein